MDKILFIINPVAGGGKAKSLEQLIREHMTKTELEYDIVFTSKPKDAIEITMKNKHETVVAVGGDGTVNEVARGLINRGYGILGIIPGGTGNDMGRSLRIPRDPMDALKTIIKGKTMEIDVGWINGHKFLNVASIGFDAEVVKNASRFKGKLSGKIAYILGVLVTLFKFRRKKITIKIDGKLYSRELILLAAGNGRYYGGGMKILPDAQLNDGYLHLCLVSNAHNLTLLTLFPTIFKGSHVRLKKYVEVFKAKSISLIGQENLDLNFDGEIINNGNEVKFELAHEKLKVIYE